MFILRNPLRSIRGKLITTLLMLVVMPTLFIVWSYTRSSNKLVEEEVFQSNQQVTERYAQSVNDMAERMVKATALFELDLNQLYSDSLAEWTTSYTAYNTYKLMQMRLSNVRDLLLDSRAFLIYLDNKGFTISSLYDSDNLNSYQDFIKEDWIRSAWDKQGYPSWNLNVELKPGYGYTVSGLQQRFLVVSRTMRTESNANMVGIVAIGIPVSIFFNDLAKSGADGTLPPILLKDSNGQFYDLSGNLWTGLTSEEMDYSLRSSLNNRLVYNGRTYLCNEAQISQNGLKLIRLIPSDDLTKQLERSKKRSILTIALLFLMGILLFLFLIFRFTRPIYGLLRSMKLVGAGDFQAEVVVQGTDEISLLGHNFNKMIFRLRDLLARLEKERWKREEARFQALQAQINPHFLLNTLNSIKLMAMLSNTNRDVSDMITVLGKLLEYSMNQHRQLVTLREELEYLEMYMSLQKIRYHDNIGIVVEVSEELLSCSILKFSLQPLVENSIIHGGKLPLLIWISTEAGVSEDSYTLIVRDNGKGVTEEELDRIYDKITQTNAKYSGIGISNVNQRIKLHFGEAYGTTITNVEGGGLEARLLLPLRKENP